MSKIICLVLFFSYNCLAFCQSLSSYHDDILGGILIEKIECISSYNNINHEFELVLNFYDTISENNYKAGLFTRKGKYEGSKVYQYSLTLLEKKENEMTFKIPEMELTVLLKIKERYAEIYQKNRNYPNYICS